MIVQRPATLTVTGSWGGWCLFPAVIGREEGYTLGRSSVTYHRNMQTPCRKTAGWDPNPGLSCCKATVLPSAPLCSPALNNCCCI
ncbi:hypothetical protein ILYODFUR_001463 [Ilyodon furcidens]|uniref:Uncharacterized protein n=1 Tax=Ilyodon furcidens TaxID=33524 RepID=A0ABV0T4E6_9TELE